MDNIVSPKLICVEGKDEVNFFSALLTNLGIINVQIFDFEGKSNYKSKISALINMQGFESVEFFVLIRDADENPPDSAFTSLVSILGSVGLPQPAMDQKFSTGIPQVGIFIMPGDGQSGALEDLCLDSIQFSEHFSCVEEYFDCIDTELSHPSKAKVLCYLAGKDPYSNSLGLAALKGHWDFSNDSFNDLIIFLKYLQ
jgi:hypothetical protein